MNKQTVTACFDIKAYSRFLDQQSGDQEEAKILAHLDTCKTCQAMLEKMAGQEKDWNDIQSNLAGQELDSLGEETQEIDTRDRQRDLKKVQAMLAPTDDPEMMGRLGGYEICGVIGRGSTGIVVKALDTRLNRYVAIKLLAPAYSNNGCSRRRFEREGRAIASVKNPHVVPIHTVDEFQGNPYIVMQYIPDGSLDQRIKNHGPLSTKQAVCIGMQIAQGLAAAHERGIVHRDVKPANVLLENGINGAMVTDFGLARVVDEATMTRSGSISGTPQFMSPEQAKGERVDPRSDLFSLGSVLYAACTGRAPFKSESVFGVIKKVCDSNPPPIREINPDIAPWLAALVNKLHEKEPQNRFESADQVAKLLSTELAYLESPTMVPRPERPWWKKPRTRLSKSWKTGGAIATGLAAGAAILIGGALTWNWLDAPVSSGTGGPTGLFSTFNNPEPKGPLALMFGGKQKNEELEQFENIVETTIDVKNGGTLFLRSNLGSVSVSTHDNPVVEMKMIQTVAAEDESNANLLFQATKFDYDVDSDEADGTKLKKGRDAAIVVDFPKQHSNKHDEATEEQSLVSENCYCRNARFEILVPVNFDLDVHSASGPIVLTNINGDVNLVSKGGRIDAGNIGGDANMTSHGGHIRTGDLGGDATFVSHGGHIEMGNVDGGLQAISHGGHILAATVQSEVEAETHGGNIKIAHAQGTVDAKTMGGGITIWKADDIVDAKSSAGAIHVNFVGQPDGDCSLHASAGTVHVGYLEDLQFQIIADSTLGRVKGPFVDGKTQSLRKTINDGEHTLKASADTGSVKFHLIDDDELENIEKEISFHIEEARSQAAFDVAYDLHMAGKIDEAIPAHKFAATFKSKKGIATYNLGCAWALKGETDKAFDALNNAVLYGFNDVDQYETDSDLDSLRSDERFDKLMQDVGADTVESASDDDSEAESCDDCEKKECDDCDCENDECKECENDEDSSNEIGESSDQA